MATETTQLLAYNMKDIYTNTTLDTALPATPVDSLSIKESMTVQKFLFLMECLTYAIFTVGLVGIIGNILIICTYCKLGFSESINISYLAMALSDFWCVASIVWSGLCWNPGFFNTVLAIEAREVVLPTGGFATTAFGKITAMITAFISLERCLCVVFPLRVKTLITRSITMYFIAFTYVVHVVPTALVYIVVRFEWKFSDQRNQTVLGVNYLRSPNEQALTDVLWMFHSLPLQFIPLTVVVVCTIFLVITLNRSARWRKNNAQATSRDKQRPSDSDHSSSKTKSTSKEDRVAKTVLIIAIVFIVCSSPAAINNAITRAEPEYRAGGQYRKLNLFIAGSAACLNTVNSSVNIFIYYNMGSKFKLALKKLMCIKD